MREKSKKSTKPIHEPNFLNWTKTGKIDKTPVFQLVSWTKKEKYNSRIGHTSFSFWQAREAYRFLFGDDRCNRCKKRNHVQTFLHAQRLTADIFDHSLCIASKPFLCLQAVLRQEKALITPTAISSKELEKKLLKHSKLKEGILELIGLK